METWTGRGRQLDPSRTNNISVVTCAFTVMFAIAGAPHIETTYEWFPTKWPQSFGKIAGMSALLTQIFLWRGWHCIVIPARIRAEGVSGSFLQDRWWQVIWLQAGGGRGGGEGEDGKFQRVLSLRTDGGGGYGSNFSGGTRISWHF